jgi:hypothetical protein
MSSASLAEQLGIARGSPVVPRGKTSTIRRIAGGLPFGSDLSLTVRRKKSPVTTPGRVWAKPTVAS